MQPILNKLESLNQEEAISLHVPGQKYDYRSYLNYQ